MCPCGEVRAVAGVSTAVERARRQFLATLTPADADSLVRRGTIRTFARGQALLHEGQIPDRVLLVRSGRVKVYSTTPSGKEVVLAVRGPGELVGELSALDEEPRSASIVALERVEAIVLSSKDFRRFLVEHPPVALSLLGMLSRRLRDADAKRVEYSALRTMGRVAMRIVEIAERWGETKGDVIDVELPISQEDLAGWTGASLESVGRALQTMRGLGWIETRRRQIRVLDLEAMRRAAE
jgi:CRP/FNR family cyclic AMP-dependent transcriptional regulator